MKAQGLPINFIVLAAVGIFILILAVMFVLGGGSSATAAMSPQQVRNTCNNACVGLQQYATGQSSYPGIGGNINTALTAFCKDYTISGVSAAVKCDNVNVGVSCRLVYADGTGCTVNCTGANAQCKS